MTRPSAASRRSTAKAQAECDAFNRRHAVGSRVLYWRGAREGEGLMSTTRTEARVLSGHTAVIWINGCSGCIALSHVEVLP